CRCAWVPECTLYGIRLHASYHPGRDRPLQIRDHLVLLAAENHIEDTVAEGVGEVPVLSTAAGEHVPVMVIEHRHAGNEEYVAIAARSTAIPRQVGDPCGVVPAGRPLCHDRIERRHVAIEGGYSADQDVIAGAGDKSVCS